MQNFFQNYIIVILTTEIVRSLSVCIGTVSNFQQFGTAYRHLCDALTVIRKWIRHIIKEAMVLNNYT